MFGVVRRFEAAGYLKQNDRRRGHVSELIVHRNTVSETYKRHRPGKAADDLDATARWYRDPTDGSKPWRLFPYHFFIDGVETKDPIVYQVHTLDTKAPHAGSSVPGVPGRNARSVGIALNIDGLKVAPSANGALVVEWLLAALLEVCPGAVISRHRKDWDREHGKGPCPGPFIDVEALAESARAVYSQSAGQLLGSSGIVTARSW